VILLSSEIICFQGDVIKINPPYICRSHPGMAEVGMMRLRRDTLSKKTLAGLHNELGEKVLCVPSSE
jgi:hypothetical protein